MPDHHDISSLEEVLATQQLKLRRPRQPDYEAENRAFHTLVARLSERSASSLKRLVNSVIDLCPAESAGISLLQEGENAGQLKWTAVAGRWSPFEEELIPLDSPCGIVLERNEPLLFISPERHFPLAMLNPPAHELLLAPFRIQGQPIGTIWAVRHSEGPGFDAEDVRLLENLAGCGSLIFQMESGRSEVESRFRTLVEGIPQLVWRASRAGSWSWASPQWSAFTGQTEKASHGAGWLEMVAGADRPAAKNAWKQADERGGLDVEYRIWKQDESRYRWFRTRASPVCDENGSILEWLGTSTDIDDVRRLVNQQRALLAELQHRVRNSLSIVRSIARRTANNSRNMEEFREHFDGRLNAFARAQNYITRYPELGVSLAEMVDDELLAHHVEQSGSHVNVSGPDVQLTARIADVLGLAINELATNSIKFGALGAAEGRIAISWFVDDSGGQRQLRIDWTEIVPGGIPAVEEPGFGAEYIRSVLPYELGAETSISFPETGLQCSMAIPLPQEGEDWEGQGELT